MSEALEMARELVRKLEAEEKENKNKKVLLSALFPGETFKIGERDFIVLEHTDNGTKVISKGLFKESVVFDEDTRDYNKSSIKNIIETEIQPWIEKKVGEENLVAHKVHLTSVDMQDEFEPWQGCVRLLTFDEAREYNDFLVNGDLDDWWWTMTPWSTEKRGWKYSLAVVSPSGDIGDYGCSLGNGVRPVCILKSNIFVSKGE